MQKLLAHPYFTPAQARIVEQALRAVDPARAVRRFMRRRGEKLTVAGQEYDLERCHRVYLLGGGKAAEPMAQAAAKILGPYLTRGFLVTKTGHARPKACSRFPGLIIAEAAHPIPDESGVEATHQMLAIAESAAQDDLVICLLSGGGSALLTAPYVPLADIQILTRQLLACGANIHEINALRKHLDAVKGGGLAKSVSPATLITLILSDVIGDQLEVIASGPTAPDPSTYQQAWEILEKYALTPPHSIRRHLQLGIQGKIPETPKPGDVCFEKAHNVIIGNNLTAAEAALAQARREGYHTHLLTTSLQGEARQVGPELAALARRVAEGNGPVPPPACLISGGETTVTLHGDGLGGRNQELALAAVNGLANLEEATLVALATDGGDGPTDAAGAVITSQTREQAQRLGLEPDTFLSHNDSYHFFEAVGGLIKIGATRTNVNDLIFIFVE